LVFFDIFPNNPILGIFCYAVPIVHVFLTVAFKLHQKFISCNLFIFPVFFTLLPFIVYINESSSGWLPHFGSFLLGMYYAVPMTITTLLVLLGDFINSYKPGNMAKAVFTFGIVIAVVLTWIFYLYSIFG